MNCKIPFQEIAGLMAEKAGVTREEAEAFAKAFFDIIASRLKEGETIRIKGLGNFVPSDSENGVDFVADPELAETLNAPFALFEPEEVADDVTEETLAEAVSEPAAPAPETRPEPQKPVEQPQAPEAVAEAEPEPETKAVEETAAPETETAAGPAMPVAAGDIENSESAGTAPETEPQPASKPEPKTEPAKAAPKAEPKPEPAKAAPRPAHPAPQTKPVPVQPVFHSIEEDEEEHIPTDSDDSREGLGFGWGFALGIIVGLALGACGVYFALDYLYPTQRAAAVTIEETVEDPIEELLADTVAKPLPADTLAAIAPEPKPEEQAKPAPEARIAEEPKPAAEAPASESKPVYDTVKAGYLLQAMARKHYGAKVFWVYIYEENKAKIGNPNKLQPNMKVVIPPASKYGIDASSKASLGKAEQMERQIINKYPR
ncbi:MAG: HU family DNA-binding protein [Duncaniella sp.]|nr:HU family DNA-binding protein [Duncaniella sp.]